MKKALTIAGLSLFFFFLSSANIYAQEYVVDPRCAAYSVLNPGECNTTCKKSCIDVGESCTIGEPDSCDFDIDSVTDPYVESYVNIFGVDWGPPDQAVPVIVRLVLMAVFSVIGLAAIVLGLYGMFVRTTAGDSPEKVELSAKIFKNAIIGVIISFLGVTFIQILALLLGLEDGLFEFNLIPTRSAVITIDELNRACSPNGRQVFFIKDPGEFPYKYVCKDKRWDFQGRGL